MAPDTEQIETLFNLISSIHLSTADGSFLVPSTHDDLSNRSTLTYPSTGIQTIKTLPSNIWLKEKPSQNPDEDTSALRLPLVSQLFSMSPKAFIASPSTMTTDVSPVNSMKINEMKNDQPTNRLPMVNELLSMPIDAFKPSNKSQSSDITTKVQILPPKPITTFVFHLFSSMNSFVFSLTFFLVKKFNRNPFYLLLLLFHHHHQQQQ